MYPVSADHDNNDQNNGKSQNIISMLMILVIHLQKCGRFEENKM